MTPLSQADRELIADMRAVLVHYAPYRPKHVADRARVLQRSAARLAESSKPAQPPKLRRCYWCKRILLRGDQ
jgi:hypothetical protein